MDSLPLRIINVVTNVLVGVIVVFALLIVVGKPFGFHAYAVLSGSMEPEYHTGSLIYVKEVKPSTLGQGDVITFMTGKDTTVTHRIIDEVQGEDGVTRFQTQGDANTSADGELVHPDNVIGTPVIQIPMLGYAVNFIQFPPGTYIAISVCAIAVFLMFLPDLLPSRKDEEEEGEGERGGSPGQGRGKPRRLLPGGVGSNPEPAYQVQRPQPQAAYARVSQGAEYGRPVYAQKPRGQQAARPARAAGQQQVRGQQALPARQQQALPAVQAQRTGAPRSAQAQQTRGQQGRPAQMRQQVAGQVAARSQQGHPVQQRMPQQVQPAQRAATQSQQARPAQRQSQPMQQQARVAQAQSAPRSAANNPRLRNGQDIRSTQNAAQTNSQQAQPARRPVS